MSLLATRHFQNNLPHFLAGTIRVSLKLILKFYNYFSTQEHLTKGFFFGNKITETEL